MLINLQKSFRFTNEKDTFQVDYVFTKGGGGSGNPSEDGISLLITSCKNHEPRIVNNVSNASSIFFQSNEQITKSIEARVLSSHASSLNL